MAFNTTRGYWRSILVNGTGGMRSFASSTTPKMKVFTPTADGVHSHHDHPKSKVAINADFAPIFMVLGMTLVALSIGVHTAKQQLFYSPSVQVTKKRRETVLEVEDPYYVVNDANNFINKSFLRKVAHIQDHNHYDPIRPNPYTHPREIETPK